MCIRDRPPLCPAASRGPRRTGRSPTERDDQTILQARSTQFSVQYSDRNPGTNGGMPSRGVVPYGAP
eukprot:scaffold2760_cov59-Phaeocystis_antarctica.AAC.1